MIHILGSILLCAMAGITFLTGLALIGWIDFFTGGLNARPRIVKMLFIYTFAIFPAFLLVVWSGFLALRQLGFANARRDVRVIDRLESRGKLWLAVRADGEEQVHLIQTDLEKFVAFEKNSQITVCRFERNYQPVFVHESYTNCDIGDSHVYNEFVRVLTSTK